MDTDTINLIHLRDGKSVKIAPAVRVNNEDAAWAVDPSGDSAVVSMGDSLDDLIANLSEACVRMGELSQTPGISCPIDVDQNVSVLKSSPRCRLLADAGRRI